MEQALKYLQSKPGFFSLHLCVIEGEEMAFEIGRHIKSVCEPLGIPFAFKGATGRLTEAVLTPFSGIGDIEAPRYLRR